MTDLIDNSGEGNTISVYFSPNEVELIAEWASDIYGEGMLTLNRDQAILLAELIIDNM